MPQIVQDVLKNATYTTDGDTYRLIKLPPRAVTPAAGVVAEIGGPFCALIVDADEVTLFIPTEAAEDFSARLPGMEANGPYSVITLDVELEPELVGLMAAMSEALAQAGVSVLPYAAYSRDHIVVPTDKLEKAMETLRNLSERDEE